MKRIILALTVAALALSACKSQYEVLLDSNDVDQKYAAAFAYFDEGKFQKAAQLFESMSIQTGGTEKDDTVQYYWGLSNYRFKDYMTAQTNFEKFVEVYPNSPFTEMASFYILDCMFRNTYRYELDQTPTYQAITAINRYIVNYPYTDKLDVCHQMLDDLEERLDRKAYENAKLYYKMEDYKAAKVALRNVLKDDADNIYREQILYYTAMSSFKYAEMSIDEKKHERYLTFQDDYLNFIEEYPESEYRAELDRLYKKSKEK